MQAPLMASPPVSLEVRGPTDLYTIREVQRYSRRIMIGPTDYWLDGGAHIGAFSAWVAASGARVLGFEPEPENYQLAQQNLAPFPQATCHQAALVAHGPGEANFYLAKASDAHSLSPQVGKRAIRVRTEALPAVLAAHPGLTGMKLDVEGAEIALLLAVEDWGRIRRLIFEYHGGFDPDGSGYAQVLTRLRQVFPVVQAPTYSRRMFLVFAAR